MNTIQIKRTAAGILAQWNAKNTGVDLELTHLQFGKALRDMNGLEVALSEPMDAAAILTGSKASPEQLRMLAQLVPSASYPCSEIGVWAGAPGLAGSVLYGYASIDSGSFTQIYEGEPMAMEFDMAISDNSGITIFVDASVAAFQSMLDALISTANPFSQYVLVESLATAEQARAGTENAAWMSPLRTAQAIEALVPYATENIPGRARFATDAETIAGSARNLVTHPAGVVAAMHAIVDAAINALVNSSPAALNQLNELAAAVGNDPSFATSVANALAEKLTQAQADGRYVRSVNGVGIDGAGNVGLTMHTIEAVDAIDVDVATQEPIADTTVHPSGGLWAWNRSLKDVLSYDGSNKALRLVRYWYGVEGTPTGCVDSSVCNCSS
ncbi:hypothetical protein [Uliginosibacterium sediminicola]|uniref:Uncharacterized protein n=1 Tax=Uliginosibacterium sediminicola TaxID=2024550 RepID=A0ABU9YVT3_9RHOO